MKSLICGSPDIRGKPTHLLVCNCFCATSSHTMSWCSLFAVGDISCDVNGSIEFLEHTTTIDKPFFSWNPLTNEATDEIASDGIAIMGVDILPTEISVESSKHFSES